MAQKQHKNKKQRRKEVVQKVKSTAQAVRKGMNIPNLLTIARIWSIPAIVFTMFFDKLATNADKPTWAWIGVAFFVLAGIWVCFEWIQTLITGFLK